MNETSVRLQPDLERPLEQIARKLDKSISFLINQAVKEFIARQTLEELRWAGSLPALESAKAGKTISTSEVLAWLESWGNDNTLSKPE